VKKFLLPFVLLFIFVFESIFVGMLPERLLNRDLILVPHFLLIVILFLTVFGDKKRGIIYAFIFGLLFDVVYTEVIGINLFMFPVIAYIVGNLMRILQSNIIVATITSIFGIALLELGVYELYYLLNITSMNFSTFGEIRLIPTLILNCIFAILFAYPLKRQSEKYAAELSND
jgi:rod shape-determining protein MreD